MSLILVAAFVVALFVLLVVQRAMVYIPNNRVGNLEKLISAKGSVRSGLIALDGEAGFQPDVLRGGLHFLMPFQYRVHRDAAGHHPAGQDRLRLRARRRAAAADADARLATLRASDFQDAARVPARRRPDAGRSAKILREGTYAINLAQFVVITERPALLPAARPQRGGGCSAEMAQLIAERDGFAAAW